MKGVIIAYNERGYGHILGVNGKKYPFLLKDKIEPGYISEHLWVEFKSPPSKQEVMLTLENFIKGKE
jgi:hypothetical protein